jgi:hypothetical protein
MHSTRVEGKFLPIYADLALAERLEQDQGGQQCGSSKRSHRATMART